MRNRLTFLSHFVICLGVTATAFFAWLNGVPQTIWREDLSMMTSVIAALFVGTAVRLGWQAWQCDSASWLWASAALRGERAQLHIDAAFGHLAERLCVMAGLAGTTIGLSLQAKALMSGSASFGALSTSLFTTASGVTAAALIAVLTFNLENGIRRAQT